MMEAALYTLARNLELALGAIALLMIAAGALRALAGMALALVHKSLPGDRLRAIFIEFARWLVAALTFQLGADIAATTIAPGWDELGRLAAIAGIRTMLTYFIDRDLDRAREEQRAQGEQAKVLHGVR
ncbi:putative membrane protein [Massilia sp. UYP11]|uniref:DUF1622 domain-containing protein n=1 Tax=Massilia sp. UYP11 TaxID=1756385 RepID=UPI003D25F09E